MGILSTQAIDINTISGITISGITGSTKDVYIFIDDYGNVTQIEKKTKNRLKYYPDALNKQQFLYEPYIIGICDSQNCSEDWVLGGDNEYPNCTIVFYADYN